MSMKDIRELHKIGYYLVGENRYDWIRPINMDKDIELVNRWQSKHLNKGIEEMRDDVVKHIMLSYNVSYGQAKEIESDSWYTYRSCIEDYFNDIEQSDFNVSED